LSTSLRPAGSPLADPGTWGHEYVGHLAAELGDEYRFREQEVDAPTPTPAPDVFLLGHNGGLAIDLLEELELVDEVMQLVDDNTYNRVCQYMIRCVNLLPPPDDISFLQTAHSIYVQHHRFPEALALAIRLGNPDLIREDFNEAGNPCVLTEFRFDWS
jgi:26S proteasome regulatory subunit N1